MTGSIPAGAGEPASAGATHRREWVYPRGRGGTSALNSPLPQLAGLSPRARGNLNVDLDHHGLLGSIPAGAGEPTRRGLTYG